MGIFGSVAAWWAGTTILTWIKVTLIGALVAGVTYVAWDYKSQAAKIATQEATISTLRNNLKAADALAKMNKAGVDALNAECKDAVERALNLKDFEQLLKDLEDPLTGAANFDPNAKRK